jgi:arylsulfatase
MKVAAENHVLPIDDRSLERFNPALAGRPDLMGSRTSLVVYPGMTGMMENAFINVKNKSFAIDAKVEIPSGGASGVIVAQAGRFGGWSLWLNDGRPTFSYNWLGIEHYDIVSDRPIEPGNATIRFEFAYDGGKPGAGGTGTVLVNGKKIAEGRINRTQPYLFSADEGSDVGMDEGTPVTEDYQVPAKFSGTIEKVTIDVKPVAAADQPKVDQNNAEGSAKEAGFD